MRAPALIPTLVTVLLAGCAAGGGVVILDSGPRPVGALLAAHPPEVGRNITPFLLESSEHSSRHLVWVRDREAPHLHPRHDLVVVVLEGHGSLWVRDREVPMRAGDIATVPAGVPHWFVNLGDEPAAAFVVFSPPSDGGDNVPVTP